jgi:glycosyltransferase involved in cell wall biosynthesis
MNGPARSAEPLLSVVIPSYNRADYIGETIESVLQQTYSNIEVVVIDDGSTDNTAQVVEPFAPRVRYIRQENAERGASRNHGLRLAKGEYIAFLDSDDLWLPDKAERGIHFLRDRPGVGMLCTDAIEIDGEGKERRLLHARGYSGKVTGKLLQNNFVIMPTHLARTSVVREIGGFREERKLSGSEDWEMWVRLSLVAEIAYIPQVTAKYRVHTANTMSSAEGMQRSMGRAAQLFNESEHLARTHKRSLRKMDANVALVNAINYCSQRDRKNSMQLLAHAFASDPQTILDPRFGYTLYRLAKNFARL